MSIIQQFDTLGYIYTFEYYIYEKKLDNNLIDFMENNNINSFYVCFFDVIRDDIHYLVTTDSTNDLHQLITIERNNMQNKNAMDINDHQVIIHYNEYTIIISNKMTLNKIDELVNFTSEEVLIYNKTYANVWSRVDGNWTLDLKTRIVSRLDYTYSLNCKANIFSFRILSLSKIPNVRLHTFDSGVNINISDFNMSKLFPHLQTITMNEKLIYSRD